MSASTCHEKIAELDLSQPDDVLTYLADSPFASTRAEPLSGGVGNFTFRLYLKTPLESAGGAQTAILKHAKPWVASNREFPLAVERQNFEVLALRHVHSYLPSDAVATVPIVYHHDIEADCIIMEDAGPNSCNLKALLRESPLSESASRELGTALGLFLATVHICGSADAELLEGLQNNEESRRITAWITYARVVDTLKGLGDGADVVETNWLSEEQISEIGEYADEIIKKIYSARSEFTMGDFWTGNVVVRLTPDGEIDRLFVIDWELAKPGLPFLDFAQFVAEMNTLRRFHPEADTSVMVALDAYVKAYRKGKAVNETFARGAVAHVGAHMVVVTPGVKNWGSKEKTREVVKEGVDYLISGRHRSMNWLKSSIVGGLL